MIAEIGIRIQVAGTTCVVYKITPFIISVLCIMLFYYILPFFKVMVVFIPSVVSVNKIQNYDIH